MKETDIRARINAFLEKAMLPVSLGLALAGTGCSEEAATPVYSAPTDASSAGDAVMRYMGPMPDAQPDLTGVKYMAVMPDAGNDAGEPVTVYMAAMPNT